MRLIIKYVVATYVTPSLHEGCVDVHLNEVEVDALLVQVDILTAIKYYGITELLDTIGDKEIKLYLADFQDTVSM